MKRFNDQRPADVCFARGTFNAHPYVMAAMDAFLKKIDSPEIEQIYAEADEVWTTRRRLINERLTQSNLPMRFAGLPTVWSLEFTEPGRFHWLLQFYLRRQGIVLSWVGTGRLIFHFGFSDQDFQAFTQRFLQATERFREDGWLERDAWLSAKHIRRSVLKEMFTKRFGLT